MGAGMSKGVCPERLTADLGRRWPLLETSFKFHASCRHTHPAADALQQVLQRHRLGASDVKSVTARVHQGAIDVLGPITDPRTIHQAKFSMGTVLGLIAVHGRAGLAEFDAHFQSPAVVDFRRKVRMVLDHEVDEAYPTRWIGKVSIETADGRTFQGRVDEPKGDPGNTLSRSELESKAMQLGGYRNAATVAELRTLIDLAWSTRQLERMPALLPPATSAP
jgi:2-methylcitrate dehydratase PrpD